MNSHDSISEIDESTFGLIKSSLNSNCKAYNVMGLISTMNHCLGSHKSSVSYQLKANSYNLAKATQQ
jgi:hypothetical protein